MKRPRGCSPQASLPLASVEVADWQVPDAPPCVPPGAVVAIDCETIDDGLEAGGAPGGVHGRGKVVGVAVAVDGGAWYFPTAHDMGVNCAWDVHAWLRDMLAQARLVVGHNLLYDLEWLRAECVRVPVPVWDTMFVAALMDEHRASYSLEAVASSLLGEHKFDGALYEWLAGAYGGTPDRAAQAKNIGRAPPALVGPYAAQDAALALRLHAAQVAGLPQGLRQVADLEHALVPLLLEMRFRGVRVDVEKAERAAAELREEAERLAGELRAAAGKPVDIWAAASVGEVLHRRAHLDVPRTAGGAYSIRQQWLNAQQHPIARLVRQAREVDKLAGTFVDGYLMKAHVNGRVHAQFHPLKSDAGGTVSGRFSSSNPNLQNIPARNERARRLLRGCFVPDEPDHGWLAVDYSQIEYRLLAHHAVGRGAEDVRAAYVRDASTDYHTLTTAMIQAHTGIALSRSQTKNVNFGLVYGMGQAALAEFLGMPIDAARDLFETYHSALPFVRTTFGKFERDARIQGEVSTFFGRVCRFPHWELNGVVTTEPRRGARRAHTHKALNRVLQGGAADIMKLAMRDLWREFGTTLVPLVTVHDELGFSVPNDPALHARIVGIMQNAASLSVPVVAASAFGPDWGACK
jgi:DNA polymerase-1